MVMDMTPERYSPLGGIGLLPSNLKAISVRTAAGRQQARLAIAQADQLLRIAPFHLGTAPPTQDGPAKARDRAAIEEITRLRDVLVANLAAMST